MVVEAGAGQLEDEMRLALSHADPPRVPPIARLQHFGGVLPQQDEIVERVAALVAAERAGWERGLRARGSGPTHVVQATGREVNDGR